MSDINYGGGRFTTTDIRLSSALCTLGFLLKLEAQPIDIVHDANTGKDSVYFCHEPGPIPLGPNDKAEARHVALWWSAPGKYSIAGFDDALRAIARVFRERAIMIIAAKSPTTPNRAAAKDFATESIHAAAIMGACDVPLLGYERPTRRWVFGKRNAEKVAKLIAEGGRPKGRPLEQGDLCIDWMLEALRFHDWLKQIIKDPECIPVIEARDGERILRISSAMPDAEKRKWFSYL